MSIPPYRIARATMTKADKRAHEWINGKGALPAHDTAIVRASDRYYNAASNIGLALAIGFTCGAAAALFGLFQ